MLDPGERSSDFLYSILLNKFQGSLYGDRTVKTKDIILRAKDPRQEHPAEQGL